MSHIVVADLIWLHRFAQHQELSKLSQSLTRLQNPTSLRQRVADSLLEPQALRTRIDAVIIELATLVTDKQLAESIRYSNTAGEKQGKNFGLLLLHFFNHQTHHRGQASTLLFQAGIDIGVTDLNALITSEA